MDLQLTGKTALVTGSTAGIGFAIAKLLAKEGANVVLTGRSQERIDEAIGKIQAEAGGGTLTGVVVDFGKVDMIDQLLKQVPDVDILVNNVGIFGPKDFEHITDEEWLRFFDVNVLSGVRLSRVYFPKMLAKDWGRILFISSESALQIPQEMIHYGTTKTAQLAVARGLAELTKGTNVTVNSVLPGPTKSEGVGTFVKELADKQGISEDEMEDQFFREMRPTSLIHRFATTDEVAQMVAFLCSPLSSATNGAAIRVDGGVVKAAV
ncbi:SDR family NAD(P)-dependent oxidoreductase [Spirosoma soli]|uniref:SDR family NAD(P)-dependent oxidoreductase n=1 Tax=Spirosoma soli TaxID=1770529 RepID=A0ABW5M3S3_9BACT